MKLGLDTIFRVPTNHEDIYVLEDLYVLEDWKELTSEDPLQWSNNLIDEFPYGDGTIDASPYHIQNPQYSSILLLVILTMEYRNNNKLATVNLENTKSVTAPMEN